MNKQHKEEQLKRRLSYLEQDPNNLNLLIHISNDYMELGNADLALDYLDTAMAIDKGLCLGLKALIYFDLGEEISARKASQQALELNPNQYEAQLVEVLLNLLDQKTNHRDIEALLQINPQESRLWFAKAYSHMLSGDTASAKQAFEKALLIHPEFYDCCIGLAWCQLTNDELDAAQNSYQNALGIAEELADGWGGLALVHALKGEPVLAQQNMEHAYQLDANCFLAKLAQSIYLNTHNPEEAKKHLFRALEKGI